VSTCDFPAVRRVPMEMAPQVKLAVVPAGGVPAALLVRDLDGRIQNLSRRQCGYYVQKRLLWLQVKHTHAKTNTKMLRVKWTKPYLCQMELTIYLRPTSILWRRQLFCKVVLSCQAFVRRQQLETKSAHYVKRVLSLSLSYSVSVSVFIF